MNNSLTVEELIEKLKQYNPKAKTSVVVHCKSYPFSLSCSGYEGCTKQQANEVDFYVDALCTNEQKETK